MKTPIRTQFPLGIGCTCSLTLHDKTNWLFLLVFFCSLRGPLRSVKAVFITSALIRLKYYPQSTNTHGSLFLSIHFSAHLNAEWKENNKRAATHKPVGGCCLRFIGIAPPLTRTHCKRSIYCGANYRKCRANKRDNFACASSVH